MGIEEFGNGVEFPFNDCMVSGILGEFRIDYLNWFVEVKINREGYLRPLHPHFE